MHQLIKCARTLPGARSSAVADKTRDARARSNRLPQYPLVDGVAADQSFHLYPLHHIKPRSPNALASNNVRIAVSTKTNLISVVPQNSCASEEYNEIKITGTADEF